MRKFRFNAIFAVSFLAFGSHGAHADAAASLPTGQVGGLIEVADVFNRDLVLASYTPQSTQGILQIPVPTQDLAVQSQIDQIIAGQADWPQSIPVHIRQQLIALYSAREARAIWFGPGGWNPALDDALGQVAQAAQDGLNPTDYGIDDLDTYRRAYTAWDLAASELMLSAHFLPYVNDMINGRYAAKPRFNAINVLNAGIKEQGVRAFFDGLIPEKLEYQRLRTALADLRANRIITPDIPQLSAGRNLRRGSRGARVADLRYILTLTGDYVPDPAIHYDFRFDATLFDERLRAAVISYQKRHGLSADGIVGPGTRRVMNHRTPGDITLIKINMERLRWEAPLNNEPSYVRVNIPFYRLHVRQNSELVLDMKATVGRIDRQTPIMSDRIVNLKFSPDWTVPSTIYSEDILPRLQADPAYAQAAGYTIFTSQGAVAAETIDWSDPPAVTVYKHASSSGPLGGVRFSLTNNVGIFLHDTNEPSQFRKSRLALSSGCVRVGEPVALAHFLTQQDGLTPEQIKQAMSRGRISWQPVNADAGIPVFLSYMTIFVDDEGQLIRTDDPYRKDQELIRFFNNL